MYLLFFVKIRMPSIYNTQNLMHSNVLTLMGWVKNQEKVSMENAGMASLSA